MAKFASSEMLDAGLAVVAEADRMLVLAGQPASCAEALAGRLADLALTPADFSLGAAAAGGRRLDVAARSGAVALAAGTANHVALIDAAGGRLLYVTTCPPQPLVSGAGINIAAWSVEIGAPV